MNRYLIFVVFFTLAAGLTIILPYILSVKTTRYLVNGVQLAAGIIISFGQISQLIKTIRTKDVTGLSEINAISVTMACWMFEIYAIYNYSLIPVFFFTNTACTILSTAQLLLLFKHMK